MVLKAHFLNVGHGDCTFIDFPSGRLMMVDINNSKSLPSDDIVALAESKSLSTSAFEINLAATPGGIRSWESYYESLLVDPWDYYQANFSGRPIFRYVQTHPDMDHMGGLHRFFWQAEVPLLNFWDTEHSKVLDSASFEKSPYSELDWLVYTILRGGEGPNDSTHKVFNLSPGDSNSYWDQDGIEILSPSKGLVEACNESKKFNNISYILKISHAGRSIILPGDAESDAWDEMIESNSQLLNCDVLKASHHGRESGYDYSAVAAMDPAAVICSVGKKPSTDASDEYSSHGSSVFSTRYHGSITVSIWDDGDVWVDDRNGSRLLTLT